MNTAREIRKFPHFSKWPQWSSQIFKAAEARHSPRLLLVLSLFELSWSLGWTLFSKLHCPLRASRQDYTSSCELYYLLKSGNYKVISLSYLSGYRSRSNRICVTSNHLRHVFRGWARPLIQNALVNAGFHETPLLIRDSYLIIASSWRWFYWLLSIFADLDPNICLTLSVSNSLVAPHPVNSLASIAGNLMTVFPCTCWTLGCEYVWQSVGSMGVTILTFYGGRSVYTRSRCPDLHPTV